MPSPETASSSSVDPKPERSPITRLAQVIGQAARFEGDLYGLGKGEKAALARLDPEGELRPHQIAALARALVQAGLEPEHWRPETWQRWALIAHGLALTGHANGALGAQLHHADVSESRVTKLLTARGTTFRQLLPRLLRLLASREVAPNWHQLGGLILHESRDEEQAETIRMQIAARYFSAVSKSESQATA
ncbi:MULTISPECIES: type I-E CRISPR-associated protein Cse2/CasB [Thiorhodovibrio]|uniref:type I-E CRISPR-associated protein Cse2/CasB n=1 Tax=Thiorhodovibrio TaxID=61593 RepID=UPI00191310F2|nr:MULTISPECIES: type I-E CRISPR-associated protein Cse2/CasB [Thiorhodovibrio]MBK5969329.1 CRISPR-associated protein Cse2 [Thiorhodovibrio winogradskyi]WPL13666.1 CRISPR-associated protein CasB/Cse2 [Thiorhodovibrio litoralis]